MERLTIDEIIEHCNRKTEMYEKACDVKYLETAVMGNGIKEYWEHKQVAKYLRQLKDYEDLEEQGRLAKLPCKVGDVVYVKMASYCKTHYVEAEVRDFVHFISCGFCVVVTSKYFDKEDIPFSEFGKTIFLTKEEAKAKLKELRGGENDRETEICN